MSASALFDAFNYTAQQTTDFVVVPFGSDDTSISSFTPPSSSEYVSIVDSYYSDAARIKGMGENDLGVTFSGTVGDPLYDEESRSLLRDIIDGVKSDSARHGVPFNARSSGLTLDPSDVRNGLLQDLGLKRTEFFLFGGSPPQYKKHTQETLLEGTNPNAAFGKLYEVIAAAAESGLNTEVGIRRGDRAAGQLATSLGATSVTEYPLLNDDEGSRPQANC
ncbi:hypothetical protein TL16_g11621 [Triparma laevis f. inornata]|uniref:Uncharacterized protein n=1 Tax=Triparma laevis f. inornata TaxID=1714386 RepID=A0A9W7BGC0_9STRA|nr:hypothetical protein TL16_g11621 [Triparma laevis f. inornata]